MGKLNPLRATGDNSVLRAAEIDTRAENRRIPAEARLPQSESQDDALLALVFDRKVLADDGLDAEQWHQLRRDDAAEHLLTIRPGLQVIEVGRPDSHPIERRGRPLDVLIIRQRQTRDDQTVGIRKRQRFEQYRIRHAEDRRGRANGERKRQDDDGREAGSFQKRSSRIFDVVHISSQPRAPNHSARNATIGSTRMARRDGM